MILRVVFIGLFFFILLQKTYAAGQGTRQREFARAESIVDGIFAMIFMLAAIFWWDA